MKKLNLFATGLLAVAAGTLLAPAARAGLYTTGDLILAFEEPGQSNDYLVDLGPASYFLSLANTPGTTNLTTALSLGNLAADLSSSSGFGSSWAANSTTPGSNLQWGVFGATSNILGGTSGSGGTFGLPKNTIFLTEAELTPGSGSTAPAEKSQNLQGTWNSAFVSFSNEFNGLTPTANSTRAAFDSASNGASWTTNDPSFNAFGSGLAIEQPSSGNNIGPTNSQLDLYELLPTNAGGTGTGRVLGSFSLDGSGDVFFTSAAAVPEPATYAEVGLGVLFLAGYRHRRRAAISRA